jgi:hypothetical protein
LRELPASNLPVEPQSTNSPSAASPASEKVLDIAQFIVIEEFMPKLLHVTGILARQNCQQRHLTSF